MSFGIYNLEDQVLSSDAIVTPMWTNGSPILNTFFTSSAQEQTNTGKYFLGVYQSDQQLTSSAEEQFAIAYGHISGSGSAYYNPTAPGATPTRNIYGQFRSLVYGDENSPFTFGTSTQTSKDIIVISVDRARFKESFSQEGNLFVLPYTEEELAKINLFMLFLLASNSFNVFVTLISLDSSGNSTEYPTLGFAAR